MELKTITGTHASDIKDKYDKWMRELPEKPMVHNTHYQETFVNLGNSEDSGMNCTLMIFYI